MLTVTTWLSSLGLKRKRSPASPLAFRRGQNPPHLLNSKHVSGDTSIMAMSLDSHNIWQTPPQPVPAWACKEPGQEVSSRSKSPASHTRSNNLINRASAAVQKRTPPSTLLRSSSHSTTSTAFATLSEEESLEKCETVNNNEEPHDSLEDIDPKCDVLGDSPKPPEPVDLMANIIPTSKARGSDASSTNRSSSSKPSSEFEDDDEEEIGDISSSSEIEIDADPMAEVTTPQIEEMQAKMNSAFSRAGKQTQKKVINQDVGTLNEYQSNLEEDEEEDDDEDECDKTLRESFCNNSNTGKSISIIAAANKAKNLERKSKYLPDENNSDLQSNSSTNLLSNNIEDNNVHRYSNSTDDDPDDGFSPSTNGEDEGETDADDEIEDEGIKGSNRTPDSLLSPVSDDIPPAKGWV